MKPFSFACLFVFISGILSAQISFTRKTDLLKTPGFHSGVAIAVCDFDGDGRDDIARLNEGSHLYIEYQRDPNAAFEQFDFGAVANEPQWGICAADFDQNGFADLLFGGSYDQIKFARANDLGSGFVVEPFNSPGTFVQCVNFADINGDHWPDAFICHDDGMSRIFVNDGAGQMSYIPDLINLATVPSSDNSGNYGSVWSDVDNDGDVDLYIAKCRQNVSNPSDPRRINQLFLNDGTGQYTQDIDNTSGLRIGAQSWTADFGDIDNDGDFDCFITNHDVSSQLLINNGNGVFVDYTVNAGLFNAINGLPIQGIFRDIDNDGFLDILVSGDFHYIFRNNGNQTFTEIPNPFGAEQMESYGVGDLNEDGFLDIYAGYAEIFNTPSAIDDALWMNNGNNNHYFAMRLRGVQSNRDALGAKVVLYTPAGRQMREVRSGESYGIMNSMNVHFGLGQQTSIDSVLVYWPSGHIDTLYQPTPDAYLTFYEGGCSLPSIQIAVQGTPVFCSGDSLMLTAPAGYSYLWSNGDTTQQIWAKSGGNYRVSVTNAQACTGVSQTIALIVDPVEIPTIAVLGDTVFCQGQSVTLRADAAAAYWWSNGGQQQEISVTSGGTYFVATQGLCDTFQSAPVQMTMLPAPAPTVQGDTILENESAVLTATGSLPMWWAEAVGGTLLFAGDTLLTGPLSESDTFWVSDLHLYGAPSVFTGMTNHQGTLLAGNTFNGEIIFDCFAPVQLANVKVYASVAGERRIVLLNEMGDVLQADTFAIPEGTSIVPLNFDIPVGSFLRLSTDAAVNQANLGTVSPQLRRSDMGIMYPYVVPGYLEIYNSNFGSNRYYYFYDWEVRFYPDSCRSERVPVVARVDSMSAVFEPSVGFLSVNPNPFDQELTIQWPQGIQGVSQLLVTNIDGRLMWRQAVSGESGGKLRIDGRNWPSGAYLATLFTEQGLYRGRVLKL